jgi:hypothetical protein
MADLRLTPYVQATRCTDLDLTNRKASLVTGPEEIAQRIRITLQTQLGESLYDKNGGTPYLEVILSAGANPLGIRAAIAAVVRGVTGVRDVKEIDVVVSGRTATITGIAIATDGSAVSFGAGV